MALSEEGRKQMAKGWVNVRPPRTKPKAHCMITSCKNLQRAKNLCNRHYLRAYFLNEPKTGVDRGRRGLRRHLLEVDVGTLAGINRIKAQKAVKTVFSSIVTSLKRGETVTIRGFGTFVPRLQNVTRKFRFKPDPELVYMVNNPTYRGIA